MTDGLRAVRNERGSMIACLLLLLGAGGCVSRPPTIAHVHLGHALTGVHVTPNREGYLLVGEKQAQQAYKLAQQAHDSTTIEQLKTDIAGAVQATSSENEFGLKQSVILASNHISFAATSADSSLNVQQAAPVFAKDIARVVERCELITLLGKDVAASKSKDEAVVISEEILKLSKANVEGEDVDSDGKLGTTPTEYGMAQLRGEFDAMIARESPPYHTVDQWYLFNLVRLPSGRWVFDKLGRGGNIDGYK
jgi:hypothetical protein